MRFTAVCLLVVALLTGPVLVGCGGGAPSKKAEPSAAVDMPGATLPGAPGAPPKPKN